MLISLVSIITKKDVFLERHPLTSEDEKFVSLLIANAASKNPMTSYLMKKAIEDFDLNNLSFVEPLVEKKLLSVSSYRPALTNQAGEPISLDVFVRMALGCIFRGRNFEA